MSTVIVPALWTDNINARRYGNRRDVVRFVQRTLDAAPDVVGDRAVVSARDAVVLFVIACSKRERTPMNFISSSTGINAPSVFVVGDGLSCKGLVNVENGAEVVFELTEKGHDLVRLASAAS